MEVTRTAQEQLREKFELWKDVKEGMVALKYEGGVL